jgi:glucosamine-6-phosphate deaminase
MGDENLKTEILKSKEEMGVAAAQWAAAAIREAIAERGHANIILATGASQFEMLHSLTQTESIDWSKVTMFHLDEYIGLDENHPASFRKYLRERFINQVPTLSAAHLIDGSAAEPERVCAEMGKLIKAHLIDVACVGIGENGHLAFNDPPADFETTSPYLVVTLDQKCREQQMGEGWFETIESVPTRAISMSVHHIMQSARIVVTVPDRRKADAVRRTLNDPISPEIPASILRNHSNCRLFLDKDAAALI